MGRNSYMMRPLNGNECEKTCQLPDSFSLINFLDESYEYDCGLIPGHIDPITERPYGFG